MNRTPWNELEDAAAAVAPLSSDPAHALRVDARFDPFEVTISRGEYRPNTLRDPAKETRLEVDHEVRAVVERTLRVYFESTRTETEWYVNVTLTVYANGQFSIGGARHGPRRS